jgi:hypothetical protein
MNAAKTLIILFCAGMSILSGCARFSDQESYNANLKDHLYINEVMAQSDTTEDWIEFYNPTSGAIDLSGFYLSDSRFYPFQWAFPDGTVILPKGFLVVKADNKNTGLHTNFRLGTSESVVLTTPGGTTAIDTIDYTAINAPLNQSYGRWPDGGPIWITYANPTKGSANQ